MKNEYKYSRSTYRDAQHRSHQGDAHQNHDEVLSHTYESG